MEIPCTAFEGSRRIAAGELVDVALKTKAVLDRGGKGFVLIFNDLTSELIEVDFRGTAEDVRKHLAKKDNPSPIRSRRRGCRTRRTRPRQAEARSRRA